MLQNQGRWRIMILRDNTVAECSLIREQVIALSESTVYIIMLTDKNDKSANENWDISIALHNNFSTQSFPIRAIFSINQGGQRKKK